MWQKVFQYFLRRFQITRGRSPMTAAEMNQIQNEAVSWINKTGGKTLPGTSQSQKPPFQGWTPKVIEGGKGKAGIGTLLKDSPGGLSDEVATSQINKLRADLPSMNRNELDQLVKDVINRKAYASFDDTQRKELLDAIEYQTTHKPDFASGGIARVGMMIGGFTKAQVLIQMLKNTIKGSKDPWVKKHFPNWIKEIQKNPSLANNENVWRELTSHIGKDKAVKNQRLIVHSDDSVDFFTQSEFGPHNIEKTLEFQKKHNLSRDQANKILQMEPEDRVLEMKRLETIRNRTMQAEGGIAGELHLNEGGRVSFTKGGKVSSGLANILGV